MAALTKDFDTKVKVAPRRTKSAPVAATTTLYEGGMVCYDASGRAVAATAALGRHAQGVAKDKYDNSAGGAGDITASIETGIHGFNNSATNTLTQADVGSVVYIEDDNTVGSLGTGSGGIAGILEEIDSVSGRCYVNVGNYDFVGYEDTTIEAKEDVDATVFAGQTNYTVAGTDTSALPDGLYIGQIKRLLCVAASATPALTVTPVSLADFTTIDFDAVGETWVGRWDGTNWQTIFCGGATLA